MPTVKENSHLLTQAVQNGDTGEVQRLIPLSDPKFRKSQALYMAAFHGHTECVKLLIPVSDPKVQNSYALREATRRGHAQCVELLIPVSDPKVQNSEVLYDAINHDYPQCVELLYPVTDPIAVLNTLKRNFPDQPDKWMALEQRIEVEEAKRLRGVLSNAAGETDRVRTHKM